MDKESNVGKLTAGMATLIGVVAGVVSIWQYLQSTPKYDINGAWTIETTTQQTSLKRFEGLHETYRVNLTQNGTQFTGNGEKWSDDGVELQGLAHTPLEITGTLDRSGHIHATFTSQGKQRESSGGFDWQVSKDGNIWNGTFASTAANSRGTSVLRR